MEQPLRGHPPHPRRHSAGALLLVLLARVGLVSVRRRPTGMRGGGRQALQRRLVSGGRPGDSVVVHRQVSLSWGLPADQHPHRGSLASGSEG